MIPQHILQPIARNPTAKVMDVVDADVRREPAQDPRQVIVGTAMQGSFMKTPGLVVGPGGLLELVLDKEQLDAASAMAATLVGRRPNNAVSHRRCLTSALVRKNPKLKRHES